MTSQTSASMLLFDLDDTLVDDAIATETAAKALCTHYQPELEAEAMSHWRRALKQHYPAFLQGQLSAAEMRQARAREALQKPELSDKQAEDAFEYFMQQYIAATQLYPDTLVCLDKLRQQGWRLALVSNGPEDMQQRKVKAAGLTHYFEFVLTAEAAGSAKPDPAIFDKALAMAKLSAKDCCYVGDNFKNDAQGAEAAGLTSVWLQRQVAGEVVAQPFDNVTWQISGLSQLLECVRLA
ncbi:HAD family hydrolase [Agarivorans sp. 1_MG-2023]|uniref:HAD family hydrolase n=1 Tax=Agarivorans sp. 1_MG-2023 TaxID=3062634 RepID=UPI0026E1CE86|nr:HAD family hydrolase [Agarivorans sp. 1_MG-2023]MDO6763812.1 HAD family hydrolase [Agarivorans sp. 1_MG-2023]